MEVGRELGARYVIEGSVRRQGDALRVSAQLIDATTGRHIWAQTYDRQFQDVLAVQSELTEAILREVSSELVQAALQRVARKDARNLDSYESHLRGYWHFVRSTKEDLAEAQRLFQRAIELDPLWSDPVAALALTHYRSLARGWTDSPEEAVAALVESAETSVMLDDRNPFAYHALGHAYGVRGDRDKMLEAYRQAWHANPSDPYAYSCVAPAFAIAGAQDEAIAILEEAIRLSPRDSRMLLFLSAMALAHFGERRYEEAVQWAERAIQRDPKRAANYRLLAATYAHMDRAEEARAALEESWRLEPDFVMTETAGLPPDADPELVARLLEGARKAEGSKGQAGQNLRR